MKIKVSKATPLQINYLVAKCEGYKCQFDDEVAGAWLVPQEGYLHDERPLSRYAPSTNWAQGGPIIERTEIGIERNAPCFIGREWEASPSITAKGAGGKYGYGPTPLIAAMRCYVASQLGDEVEVPDELGEV